MTGEAPGAVGVTFAKGVLDDVAELTTPTPDSDQACKDEAEALKRRIAELLVECKGNPFIGELMGPGLHPELANCRRVRLGTWSARPAESLGGGVIRIVPGAQTTPAQRKTPKQQPVSEDDHLMRHSDRPLPTLGKAIRQLRERGGMTQEALARIACLTGRSLSAIETGKANPTWATVGDIAAALGVPVSTLAKAAERLEE